MYSTSRHAKYDADNYHGQRGAWEYGRGEGGLSCFAVNVRDTTNHENFTRTSAENSVETSITKKTEQ